MVRFGDLLVCAQCKDSYAQKLREGVERPAAVRYGGFWLRVVAAILDGIILIVVGTIVGYALRGVIPTYQQPSPTAGVGEVLATLGPAFLWSTLVNLAIHGLYETAFISQMGATPGKMALSLKVVRPDGRPVSPGRALGRFLAKQAEGWLIIIGWIGYLMAGIDSQKRAAHDMVCDTRVIKTS